MLDPDALAHRLRGTLVEQVRCYDRIASTNDAALAHAAAASACGGVLWVARRQTAGRGRAGKGWWSDEGSLTFSLLTPPLPLARENVPPVAVGVAAAVCDALEEVVPAFGVSAAGPRIKWPNDIYLDGRKLGGVLIESPAETPPRLVIGVGVNANTRLGGAPRAVRERAASLVRAAGAAVELVELLVACVRRIDRLICRLVDADPTVHLLWGRRSLLDGRSVVVETPTERIGGVCVRIDERARLTLNTPTGTRRLVSGTVVDWAGRQAAG